MVDYLAELARVSDRVDRGRHGEDDWTVEGC
jgi:hypothetical protein